MSRLRKARRLQQWNQYADRCERLALAAGWGVNHASKRGIGRGWGRGNGWINVFELVQRESFHARDHHLRRKRPDVRLVRRTVRRKS